MKFAQSEKTVITAMVQGANPDRIKYLMDKSLAQGADAYGMQFEQMELQFRRSDVYKDLFDYAKDKPVYVTNYRYLNNATKTDDILATELLELAECGAKLCDVMGDFFDKQPGELTMDEGAVKKQMELIASIKSKGAEVIMSSHVFKYISAENVLEIALEHQRRGADISKIVTNAENMEQQIENLRIINLLKERLEIPFLFLCGGECSILRRIGGCIGNCMALGVSEYDDLATKTQPLIPKLVAVRNNM